jgi:hypothetical protein
MKSAASRLSRTDDRINEFATWILKVEDGRLTEFEKGGSEDGPQAAGLRRANFPSSVPPGAPAARPFRDLALPDGIGHHVLQLRRADHFLPQSEERSTPRQLRKFVIPMRTAS